MAASKVHKEFELIFERNIPELRILARFYKHRGTSAEVLSLINDDENKVFGISFRTPPADSTGVAHILEHSVLCGSRKYPVKEPFVELLKGSLKTFLNAFTYPDKTCYPVASQNVQDFYNLVDVYLDAVFYPRITPAIFQQEGWHYELDDPEPPLTIKGVVYNEMKGVYSSPDSVLAELSQQSLFPDITYGLDSGGNPSVIPSLTYENFKSFHEKLYHPSNARIYFYGDDDPDKRLEILQEYLGDFDTASPDSEIPLQPVVNEPIRIVRSFAAGHSEEDASNGVKSMITVNWLFPETTDLFLNMAFQVLEYILLGMPGSPLRKALIESGFGEDLAGSGLENELRQGFFSTGLKGIRTEDAEKVERLIFNVLSGLVRNGIDPATVEAGLNTIEFRFRENNSGSFPQGLVLMLHSLSTWLYNGDPIGLLAFEAPLREVKARAESPGFFEDLIRRYLLENPHRSIVLLKPEPGLSAKEIEKETGRLAEVKKSFSAGQIRDVINTAAELRRLQSAPDSPEALSKIPVLGISDLSEHNKNIPIEQLSLDGARMLYHDIFTSGIAYLETGFDLRYLPRELISYAPLFGRALLEMGTRTEDFVSLSQRISRTTGGIRPEVFTSAVKGRSEPAAWLFLRAKAMTPRVGELCDILAEVLGGVNLDNRGRFQQMVLEEKGRQERKMVPNGHQVINQRIRAHFHQADWVRELTSGISYFQFLGRLAARIENNWDEVLANLEKVRKILVSRPAMVLNLTADGKDLAGIEPCLRVLVGAVPDGANGKTAWEPDLFPGFEGISIPAQVNYVGKGANLFDQGYELNGSSKVIVGYVRTSWLWEKVRVQGGAYGGMCLFDRLSGSFTFISYRDPNLLKTIENYDATAQFLRSADLSPEEIRKAIIGAIGEMDTYMLPDTKGYVSLLRHLTGDDDEGRQKMREQVLGTTERDFREFAEVLERVARNGIVKVLGSQASIDSALEQRPGWLDTFRLL
ncbi:MAG: insulinase family protein [Syntrophobacter sp.]